MNEGRKPQPSITEDETAKTEGFRLHGMLVTVIQQTAGLAQRPFRGFHRDLLQCGAFCFAWFEHITGIDTGPMMAELVANARAEIAKHAKKKNVEVLIEKDCDCTDPECPVFKSKLN